MKLLPTFLLAGVLLGMSDLALAQATKKPAASPGAAPAPKTAAKPAAKTTTSKATAKPAATAKPTTVTATPPPKPASAHSEAGSGQRAAASNSSSSHSSGLGLSGNNDAFGKGTTVANLGIGFGISYDYLSGASSLPSISLAVDHGVIDNLGPGIISVGGLIAYKSASYDYNGTLDGKKARWTNMFFAARGAYHYNFTSNPKLDTYAGIMLGVRSYSFRYYGLDWQGDIFNGNYQIREYKDTNLYLASGFFVGARYFITDKIGAFSELGYDVSFLKLGLSAKF